MSRTRVRTRVLVAVVAVVLAASVGAAVVDAQLRSRIESQLAQTRSPVGLSLGGGSVLWGYLTGTVHIDAHVDAAGLRDAISSRAGLDVGDVSMSDGTIRAAIDGGPVSALLGGDLTVVLLPTAVDGVLTVSVSGIIVGGEERAGTALADQFGPFALDPADMMDCAALTAVKADSVTVGNDDMVVSLSVPSDVADEFADCRGRGE